MTIYEKVEEKGEILAPWSKRIEIQELTYDGGVKHLRLRIREGRRITDLELAPDTATQLATVLQDWVKES